MIKLIYTNQTKTELPLSIYQEAITNSLKKYGLTDNLELELIIVGQARMRTLNRSHRKKDYATDVLSFPIWPDLAHIKALADHRSIGSVVVCLPVAIKDAATEGISRDEKITFLIEHSLQHLLGFHHKGDE